MLTTPASGICRIAHGSGSRGSTPRAVCVRSARAVSMRSAREVSARRGKTPFWLYDWYIVENAVFLAHPFPEVICTRQASVLQYVKLFSGTQKKAPGETDSPEAFSTADDGGWQTQCTT